MKKLVLSLNEELEKTLNEEDKEKIQEQIEELNKKIEEIKKEEEKKLEEKIKLEQEKKAKKETVKKGSLKEVFSCLFGQVDKRVNNFIASKTRLRRFVNKRLENKYNNIYRKIIGWVGGPLVVMTTVMLAQNAYPAIALVSGVFAGINVARYIPTLIRKINNKGPEKISKVELSKGSYLENLKNAVSKYKNRKTVKKQVSSISSKTTSKKDESITTKSTINEKNKNIDNLLINFNNAVNSVDLNDIDITKVDNCNSCYELLKNYGEVALNKISNETKEKYQKIQEYLKLIKEFSKAINVLKSDDINKDLLDNCKSLYDLLKNNYGENAFKNIPESILNKYNDLKDIKVEKELETVRKDKELAFSKFVSELKTFKLEQTVDGIKEYENLMHRLFALDKEQRNMISNNEMLWNKIQSLRKEVKALQTNNKLMNNNTKLESFINHVETFKFGENVEFKSENLVAAISLYNQLTSDQKKMIPEKIMRNYQDAIRYDSITALKAKLYALDIDKCIAERDFDSIEECYKLYSKWYQNTSEGLKTKDARQLEKRKIDGQKQIEGLSRELSEKLQGIIKTITTKEQFANADVNVEYQLGIINGKARPISHVEVINNNEMIAVCDIPWNSKNPDVFEIRETIMEKFPFINENHIYFEGISKENNKAGKR